MPDNIDIVRPKEDDDTRLTSPCKPLDHVTLTEQEETIIQAVLQKEEQETRILETKLSELRKEIEDIRQAGALADGEEQSSICARCKFKFSTFLPWADRGELCSLCQSRICSKCSVKPANGSLQCTLCSRLRQEKLLTGGWMCTDQAPSVHGSDLLKSMLKDNRRVAPESDLPRIGVYSQRPARCKDADTESRTSKNSQSSTEQTDVKPEEKRPISENAVGISGDKQENEIGDNDKSLDFNKCQKRETHSRSLDTRKSSLIPTKTNKSGGKPHWWNKHSRSDCVVKPPKHGSKCNSEVSSNDPSFPDTQHASRETSALINSEDANSLSGGSLKNGNAQSQLVSKDSGSSTVLSGKFRRSLSQRDTDQKDNIDELSQQNDNTKKKLSKSIFARKSDNSPDSKAPAEEPSEKQEARTKSKLQKMKIHFKKPSTNNFQKIPSDEETGSRQTLSGSKDEAEVKKSKISRLVKFMTRGHAATAKDNDKNHSNIASMEQQKDHEKGKDVHVFRQQSVSVCEDVRENESRQLSSESCEESERPPLSSETCEESERPPLSSESCEESERPPLSSESSKKNERPPLSSESSEKNGRPPLSSESSEKNGRPPLSSESSGKNGRPPLSSESSEENERPPLSSESNEKNGRPLLSSESSEKNETNIGLKLRAPGRGVVQESLLLPSQVKITQNPFEARQSASKFRSENGIQLRTSSAPLRRCLSLSTEDLKRGVFMKSFSCVRYPDEVSLREVSEPSIASLTHFRRLDYFGNLVRSKSISATSETDVRLTGLREASDLLQRDAIDSQMISCRRGKRLTSNLDSVKVNPNEAVEEVTDSPLEPWSQVQRSNCLAKLSKSNLISYSSEKEGNIMAAQECGRSWMEPQDGALGKLEENSKRSLQRSGSDVSDTLSIVTEYPEPGGDCANFNFDLDSDSEATFRDTRFEDSFSDDNDIRTDGKNFPIWAPASEDVDFSSGHIGGSEGGSKTRSKPEDRDSDLDRRDSGIKFESVFESDIRDASICQQFNEAKLEASPPGYNCPSSRRVELDLEAGHSCLSQGLETSRKSPKMLHSANEPELLSSTGTLLASSPEIKTTVGGDDCPKKNELVDEKAKIETSDNLQGNSPLSFLVDSAGKKKPDQKKPTLLSLAMTSKAWQRSSLQRSNSQSASPRRIPDATVDIDDGNPKSAQTNERGFCNSVTDDESMKDTDSGITSGRTTRNTTPEQRSESADSSPSNQQSVPAIAVTNTGDQSACEDGEDDDLEELFINKLPNQLLGSRSSLADSRESIYSVYSDAGEDNYGRIPVTGEIMFHISYNHKSSSLEVHVKQCRDLAPVDTKHERSNPYVKTYLLPDKSRSSKRKTRIKKHTLNPVFDEVLKYHINSSELDSRSLWLTVWHHDRMGRNDFLGEVTISLEYYRLDQGSPMWYPLLERAVTQDPVMFYKGDLFISLKYIPADMVEIAPKKKPSSFRRKGKEKEAPESVLGEVHVLVREAQNLTAMRGSAGSNPFCKGYMLPDTPHSTKQKTPILKKTTSPQWQHILTFDGVDQGQLPECGLELTVWDHEKMSSNDFLGGVRLNLGQGIVHGNCVDWMDAKAGEIQVWQSMIEHPNEWIDAELPLRASMGKQTVKN